MRTAVSEECQVPSPRLGTAAPLRVVIVATNGPRTLGGLASYLQGLLRFLPAGEPVSSVVRFNRESRVELTYSGREPAGTYDDEGCTTRVIGPGRWALPLLVLTKRLMYRQWTQRYATRLFRRAFTRALDRAIPDEVDVVHIIGTGWEMLGPTVVPLARRRGAAVVVLPAVHPGSWGDSAFDARFYNSTDLVIALSGYERDRLIAVGVSAEKVVVCGLAPNETPDGDGVRFRKTYELGERPIVLYVGRKQRYKGFHALVAAMQIVQESVPDACLVTIGAPVEPLDDEVAPGLVLDLEACDDRLKADAFAACDVYCLPSAGEAFGIGYVEAWAYGKPVVGGPAPAVRELIRDNVDGLCTAQDPRDLAAVLRRLLTDSDLRTELGRAGRQRQLDEFSWPAIARRHEELFRAAVQARSPVARASSHRGPAWPDCVG